MSLNKDVNAHKSLLRSYYRSLRAAQLTSHRERVAISVTQQLMNLSEYHRCDTVLSYVSTQFETDTHRIIDTALADGKRVAVPRCINHTGDMEFYYITDRSELKLGAFGILEPVPVADRLFINTASSLCIVPALAYDVDGYRLGYGGGYYDRFLAGYSGVSVGICQSDCVCEALPHNDFDQRVSVIITEKELRRIRIEGEV